eukprot:7796391-Alexandrium_andersonii.AAC.1
MGPTPRAVESFSEAARACGPRRQSQEPSERLNDTSAREPPLRAHKGGGRSVVVGQLSCVCVVLADKQSVVMFRRREFRTRARGARCPMQWR